MTKNSGISTLNDAGQSVWFDFLSRPVLQSGELKGFVDAGVSGLTTNPTIFKKAIADGSAYDADIQALALQGQADDEIIEDLMVSDVGAAADLLRPCYDQAHGRDGFVSIEVSPHLAHDAAETLTAAKRLWKKLGRPNVMVKIPATADCLPAIEEALVEGININITLIFSPLRYREVARAYTRALERRIERGEDVSTLASVASFFVSRVDAIVQKTVEAAITAGTVAPDTLAAFRGKLGIANSRVAYAEFLGIFRNENFARLQSKGALLQRPLWASTSTKDATLSKLLYVEGLVAADTVTTIPPETLAMVMEGVAHTSVLSGAVNDAHQSLNEFDRQGFSFAALLSELEEQGVRSFSQSYDELLAAVSTKRQKAS